MLLFTFLLAVVAPTTLCTEPNNIQPNVLNEINQTVLQNVFGSPGAYYAPGIAVIPLNATAIDPDYWESGYDFRPSSVDYDVFDWTLTKRVAASTKENFLLSPLGLKLSFAILTEAATGATKAELQSVLGFDMDNNKVRSKFYRIIESLKTNSSQYILDLNNRVYISKDATLSQKFASVALEHYRTEIAKINFLNTSEAVNEINSWVKNVTKGKINVLVDDDDVTGLIVMILNTLYFKGTWRHQFAINATSIGPFFVTPKLQKPTLFMNIQERFHYVESPKFDAKILRMPYLGYKFSMYIIVPNSLTGLPMVMESIGDLKTEMAYLTERNVDVTLPRFHFDHTSHLDGILKELGIRQAFEDTASFPGITRGNWLQNHLKISRVLQKSGIEVNELGSTAYSVTDISLVNKFGEDDDDVPKVVANRPFLFFIEDEETRQLLFTGRVSVPTDLADQQRPDKP